MPIRFPQGLDLTPTTNLLSHYLLSKGVEQQKQEAQNKALSEINPYFQQGVTQYSNPQMVRPDVGGFRGLTQNVSPQSVSFQNVPTTPSPTDFGFLSALAKAGISGVPTEGFLQASQYNTPKVTPINQEAGGLDILKTYPSGKYNVERAIPPDFSRYGKMNGQPTELSKYQNELSDIRSQNPNDPRIPQYEDMIKKLTQGVPYFTLAQTSQGFVPVNARTGQPQAPTGLQKPLTGEMITSEQQIGALKESLDKVKSLYKPDYIGPVAGRAGGIKEMTVGVPEDQAQFYSAIADIGNTLIYLKSGKQINEQEYTRLKKQIPDKDLPESTFRGRMIEFERELNSVIENRRKAQGGYGVPAQKPIDDPLGILK